MGKAWPIPNLNPNDPLGACLRNILTTRCEEVFSYESGILEDCNEEAIHDMRVSARRLQAVLKLFRDCFPRKQFKIHYDDLSTLIRSLGSVRENDVFIAMLRQHQEHQKDINGRTFNLLLAKKLNRREIDRKNFHRLIVSLHRSNFKQNLLDFIKSLS